MSTHRIQIPRKLKCFYTTPKRYKIGIGGRGGAKSNTYADIFIQEVEREGYKIGCFREYQNSIEDSVHSLLKKEIIRLNAPGYEIQNSRINNISGGGFRFKGLTGSTDSTRSFEGFKKFWIEEGQFLSDASIQSMSGTLREEGSEFWISANPMSSADPFSQRFIVPFQSEIDAHGFYEDDMHLIVKINYMDNPWFPQVLEDERLMDYEMLSRAAYDHKWLGEFNDSVENAIITREMFDSAINAHKKLGFEPRGIKVLAYDPADTGPDDKGYIIRHGSVITKTKEWTGGDINEGCDVSIDAAIQEQVDLYTWDCDGMGIGLKRQVADALEGKKIDYHIFKGSEGVEKPNEYYLDPSKNHEKDKQRTNKETFKNKRAQNYWSLRDRFFNTYQCIVKKKYIDPDTMISIDEDGVENMAAFRSQICRIPLKPNGNGFIQIMNKIDMKRLKIKSPALADDCMMSLDIPPEQNTSSLDDMEFDCS